MKVKQLEYTVCDICGRKFTKHRGTSRSIGYKVRLSPRIKIFPTFGGKKQGALDVCVPCMNKIKEICKEGIPEEPLEYNCVEQSNDFTSSDFMMVDEVLKR